MQSQISELVQELDPSETDKITYSQIVALLSNRQIDAGTALLTNVKESLHGRSSAEIGIDSSRVTRGTSFVKLR